MMSATISVRMPFFSELMAALFIAPIYGLSVQLIRKCSNAVRLHPEVQR
jgi:hypothetical protein